MRTILSAISLLAALAVTTATCSDSRGRAGDEPDPEPRQPRATGGQADGPEDDDRLLDTPPEDALGTVPEGHGLELGGELPEAAVADAGGENVELAAALGDGAVLIGFYRGGWCPYCTSQVRELTARHDEFAERGVKLALVSADKPDEAAKTEATYEVPFPLLSDPDLVAHEAFGVVFEVPADDVERLKEMGMDLEAASGRDHHTIAMPSLFLFGEDGELLWQHADPDYSVRPRVDQILKVLDEQGFGSGDTHD
jgi:peroxiredoxin